MNYSVNFDPVLVKARAVETWVLRWCKKYHPEAFVEAEKFIASTIKDSDE